MLRKTLNQQVDRLATCATLFEQVLPLPGLSKRLVLLEVDELDRQSPLRRTHAAGAVLGETPAEVARAAVVVATVCTPQDVRKRSHAAGNLQHERCRMSRVNVHDRDRATAYLDRLEAYVGVISEPANPLDLPLTRGRFASRNAQRRASLARRHVSRACPRLTRRRAR